jgi:CubicO group peptidase (beta-lactamase class C family)
MTLIEGEVAGGYERVAEAFIEALSQPGELGMALVAIREGRRVVDLWGGAATGSAAWTGDTVVPVFSVTKLALVTCVGMLVSRGVLDLDAPIDASWPDFARHGKVGITLADVLSHRAGIPAIDAAVTLEELADPNRMAAAVAAQRPEWPNGEAHGYHIRTIGWIAGELVRRATGRSLGTWFRDELALPLALDWRIGLSDATPMPRATLVVGDDLAPVAPGDLELRRRAVSGPSGLFAADERWNTRAYLAPELPSTNGVASARAIAGLASWLLGDRPDGPPAIDRAVLGRMRTVRSDGIDRVLGIPTRFGLGFALGDALSPVCSPTAFGHGGVGGSIGVADPSSDLAVGLVFNRLLVGPRGVARTEALLRTIQSV